MARLIQRIRRRVPTTVFALGVVSFFTDMSSEMIYPLIPVFLVGHLGVGAAALGIIEGLAESAAALLKVVSGWWTDRVKKRKPFLLVGYGIAGAVRPLIGFATSRVQVGAIRFTDRVGKGIRTAPRDALIADVTPDDRRGAACGLHRAMDNAGALVGPLIGAAIGLFIVDGAYFGLTEPVERAWVAGLAPERLRGSAFGYYNAAIGIGALPASVVFGAIWVVASPAAAFTFGAVLAAIAVVMLLRVPEQRVAPI